MTDERTISFGAGDTTGRLSESEALEEIEVRKEELLEGFEQPWHGDKHGSNMRELIKDLPDVSHLKENPDPGYHLWAQITSRYPSKEDRSLLTYAYRDNFLPPILEEHAELFDESDRSISQGLAGPHESEQVKLSQKIDSAEKTIQFLELFEKNQAEAGRAKEQDEQWAAMKETRKSLEADKAEALALSFGLATFEIPIHEQEPKKHNLPDYAASIGSDLWVLTDPDVPEERRAGLTRSLSTLRLQIATRFPDIHDRQLLLDHLKKDDLQKSLALEKLLIQHSLHEKTTEQIAEEKELMEGLKKAHLIAQAVETALR